MNKIFIITQREYLYRVQKKSFLLLTLLMPFLFIGIAAVPFLLSQIKDDEQKKVIIVDKTGRYAPLFQSDEAYLFETAPALSSDYRSEESGIEAVVSITAPLETAPDSLTVYSRTEVTKGLLSKVEQVLEEEVKREKLKRHNITNLDKIISDVETPITAKTVKWDEQSEVITNTELSMVVGSIFSFLIYLFVLSYGGMVMSSVVEEKSNRIVEIIVSSVKPFQLMMGKIIGVGLVGLTQFSIWAILCSLGVAGLGLFVGADAAMATASATTTGGMTEGAAMAADVLQAIAGISFFEIILMFVLCFLGGYLLYASLFAAVGASINEQEDATQFNLPLIFIMMFSLYAAMGAVDNPNGPLAFWASMFPLTSPIVMMVRVPFSVPLWQELLSLAILFGTATAFVWFGGRIYRVGILMYGKKPTIKEMLKWLRYH